MGLYYAYRPKASFLGKLWWHLDGDFIHPLEWPDAEHKLEPVWVRFIEWVIYLGGDLWQFKGLDPAGLTSGERNTNLRMCESSDNPVTRYLQFKRPYLRTGATGKGRITVEVLRAAYSL